MAETSVTEVRETEGAWQEERAGMNLKVSSLLIQFLPIRPQLLNSMESPV